MAKKREKAGSSLVLEHLENVSWKVLDEYSQVVRKMIRGRSGVYALYRREHLYYVGLATNLMSRLNTHLRDRHKQKWDRFSVYILIQTDHKKELESLILRIVDPPGNKQKGKFSTSRNLHPELNRLMCDIDADRRALILGGHVERRRRRTKTRKGKGTIPLAGIVSRRIPLKAKFKGEEYKATLLKDGSISFGGHRYESPTAAAKPITGRSVNGWLFWKFKKNPRNWVDLKEIRT